jgi:hypothetical protein
MRNHSLPFEESAGVPLADTPTAFLSSLEQFTWEGRRSVVTTYDCPVTRLTVPIVTNEFWTSRQRAAHSLHEVSYRACFKPQVPRFFIERLTRPGDTVYDPFAGRGTTLLEAALLGRVPAGCDVNPISRALLWPRLQPPSEAEIGVRLAALDLRWAELPEDLLTFYHPETLAAVCAMRAAMLSRQASGELDAVDEWLRMVTLNRLTGHSPGFLSVYTLPPNQAVTVTAQRKINERRQQTPPHRDLRAIVRRKSAQLLRDVDAATRAQLASVRDAAWLRIGDCRKAAGPAGSVRLIVTSPPFLDVVDYAADNWLRSWFLGLDAAAVPVTVVRRVDEWRRFVTAALAAGARLLEPGGFVAFEVGEVRRGAVRLEHEVIPCGVAGGLQPVGVLINEQRFTKTANIWGVTNNARGTNTNRVVVFHRP